MLVQNVRNVIALGLGSTCGWFGSKKIKDKVEYTLGKETEEKWSYFASCAFWDSSFSRSDRFIKKHLLEAFGVGGQALSSNDVLQWSRAELNQETKKFLNYATNGNPEELKYGIIKRLTIILESSQEFNQEVYDNTSSQPLNVQQLSTGPLKRNPKYHKPGSPTTFESNMIWHEKKCSVLFAVFKSNTGDYVFYTIDNVFLILGADAYANKSQRIPVHLEGFIVARPGENDALDLQRNNTSHELQERILRSESFINWFIVSSTCIHGVK